MDIIISVNKESLYPEVYKVTGITGKTLRDIDKVSATEDEIKVVDRFFLEAGADLSGIVSNYGSVSQTDTGYTITFSLPPNWKEAVKDSLENNIQTYLINNICMKWFAVTNKEDIKYYTDKLMTNATNIVRLLSERKKPKRE